MKPTDGDRDPAFDRLIARGLDREIDVSGNACPDADLLAAWFDHTLSALERERIEAHVSGCACCQQILASLARSEPEVVRAAPAPAPAHPWHWHWRWLVPLATAAVVVVVGTRTLRAPGPVVMSGRAPSVAQAPVSATAELRVPEAKAEPVGAPPAAAPARKRESAPSPGAPSPAARAESDTVGLPAKTGETARAEPDAAAGKAITVTAQLPVAPRPPEVTEEARLKSAHTLKALLGAPQASVSVAGPSGTTTTWRFGRGGTIERSSDGGQTWERQSSGVTTALTDASALTDSVCWIVGERGVVLRTTDGRTWQALPSPTEFDLVAVHAWSETAATITASDRAEYETTDGGKSWRRRQR